MKFLLDEGVTASAGRALATAGYEVIFFNKSGLLKGTADTVVCVAATEVDAILVAHDRDMKVLARGHGIMPARFKKLSLLQLLCRESASPTRIKAALSLLEHEWQAGIGRERRFHVAISDSTIRTYR